MHLRGMNLGGDFDIQRVEPIAEHIDNWKVAVDDRIQ